jgi:uncharacterized membrane protein
MNREDLLTLANKHRDQTLIAVLLGSYHTAMVELAMAMGELANHTSLAQQLMSHSDSSMVSPAVAPLQRYVTDVTVRAARIDEVLYNIAIVLEKLGEDVRW